MHTPHTPQTAHHKPQTLSITTPGGTRLIGHGQPVFIIAEAGVNHDGNLEKAKRLIDIAHEAGVDAVKFQTWKTEALILQGTKKAAYQEENTGKEESQFDMIKKLELPYEHFRELKQYCDEKGILFLSTPDEEESAQFLNGLVPCFKIGSGELTNIFFLKCVAKLGKPIILSTGMGTVDECRKARDVIFSTGNKQLIMLHCTSDYPTPFSDVNLRAMETLDTEMNRDAGPVLVGYSDHTEGISVPVVAAAQGAVVIEKHFTYDKNAAGPDHKASLSPDELKEMVRKIRETEIILGSAEKKPTPREQETKKVVRKSLVAKVPIARGEVITEENITAKRAEVRGFTADRFEEVVGRRAAKNIGVDEIIDEKNTMATDAVEAVSTNSKRKICVVTGTRAEYGILRPVIAAIKKHPNLELQLVAAGMHLSEEFGMTKNEIEKEGYAVDAMVDMLPETDDEAAMARAAARGITGFVEAFKKISPAIVVVLGDRIEAFAAAVAGSFLNIPVAHISGGDKTKAGRDEEMRHALTKFAKIHFPATKTSGERIVKMGEDAWRVFVVGEPSIDTMKEERLLEKEELKKYASLDFTKTYAVVVQHPVTTETEKAGEQMRATLAAVQKEKIPALVLYPNADSGGRRMIEVIKEYEKYEKEFAVVKSLPHVVYLSMMKHAACIVGNSSSGIVEAPTLKVPAVNIGIRQEGRECASNVVHVSQGEEQIRRAIKTVLSPPFKEQVKSCVNPYGEGNTSKKITDVLAAIPLDERLLKKTIAY